MGRKKQGAGSEERDRRQGRSGTQRRKGLPIRDCGLVVGGARRRGEDDKVRGRQGDKGQGE